VEGTVREVKRRAKAHSPTKIIEVNRGVKVRDRPT